MIRVGTKDSALQQLETIYQQAGVKSQNYLKFCPNISKIEKELEIHKQATAPKATPATTSPAEKQSATVENHASE